jgi:hypothetical protein
MAVKTVIGTCQNDLKRSHDDDEYRTVYSSGAPEFTPGFSRVRVTRSLVLGVHLYVL